MQREFKLFAALIGGILLCAFCGELLFSAWNTVPSYATSFRSVAIYILVIFAFGLGGASSSFNARWLVPLLITAVALNLAFVFLKDSIPSWIIDLYYPASYVEDLALDGIVDARDVLELARPRGLFGNPNQSALMVNVIALAIHLMLRNRLLELPGIFAGFCVILGPLLVAASVASRGESIVALALGALNFRYMMRGWPRSARIRALAVAGVAPLLVIAGLGATIRSDALIENFNRVMAVVEILDKPVTAGEKTEGVARPVAFLQFALKRAVLSPVFGTGFSSSATPPYDYGKDYFHNDWLRLLVTSGVAGVMLMLYIIGRFCFPLGWPAVIPFVLPGIVNTFQLSIPAFVFYFFMVGVIRARLTDRMAPEAR